MAVALSVVNDSRELFESLRQVFSSQRRHFKIAHVSLSGKFLASEKKFRIAKCERKGFEMKKKKVRKRKKRRKNLHQHSPTYLCVVREYLTRVRVCGLVDLVAHQQVVRARGIALRLAEPGGAFVVGGLVEDVEEDDDAIRAFVERARDRLVDLSTQRVVLSVSRKQ
jgi:hypothetical protein